MVQRGDFIVVSWFVFVVYDGASMTFYCGGFESVLLRFRGSGFFGYQGEGGRCEVHLNNGSPETADWWILMDGKWKERSGSRERALGRLVDWFTVRVSESFIKYRLAVVAMVDHHVAWHIPTKLDGRASIASEAHMCCVRRETAYNESSSGSKRWASIFVVVAYFGLRRVLREKSSASIRLY